MKRSPIETAAGETFGGEPEPVGSRQFRARTIIFAALAGLSPVAVFCVLLWRAM